VTVAGRSSKSVWPALCLILLGCSVRHIVYPAPPVSVQDPPRRLRAQTWSLGDGTQVSSWVHDERGLVSSRPAVLFLHGNGENLETMRQVGLFEELLALDVPFVALDYPGYGRSTGVPSEASILAAGSVALEWMVQHFGDRPIVVAGWSLGAAVAIGLAAANPEHCGGVVAMSAWTSLADVGASHFPRWLVEVALADRYDSTAAAERVVCPALVIHGSRDRIIPVEQGREVAAALGADWLEVPSAGHNDLLGYDIVWRRLVDFLASLQPPSSPERPTGL
jgi:pimeloyl-ACP methyl ester carboxylesterase